MKQVIITNILLDTWVCVYRPSGYRIFYSVSNEGSPERNELIGVLIIDEDAGERAARRSARVQKETTSNI